MEDMSVPALPSRDAMLTALSKVNDPEIRKPITELGMVKSVEIDDAGKVALAIFLTVSGCPMKETLTRDSSNALLALEGVTSVEVELDVMSEEQRAELRSQLRGGAPRRRSPSPSPTASPACMPWRPARAASASRR